MRELKVAWFAASSAAVLGLALLACESATNLDVAYTDASTVVVEASADGGEGGVSSSTQKTFPGCPCDESAGLGCCIQQDGPAFCTADTNYCTSQKGTHLKCGRPDPTTESVCCWSFPTPKSAIGAVTALASACDAGPLATACSTDTDCAGTGAKKCSTVPCGGITIGQCGESPPPCAVK